MAHDPKKAFYELQIVTLTENTRKAMTFVGTADIIRTCLMHSDYFYALRPNLRESIRYLSANESILAKLIDTLLNFEFGTQIQLLQGTETSKKNKRFFSGEISKKDSVEELNLFYNLIVSLGEQSKYLIGITQKILNSTNALHINSDIMETMFKQLEEQYEQFYTQTMTLEVLSTSIYDIVMCRKNFTR